MRGPDFMLRLTFKFAFGTLLASRVYFASRQIIWFKLLTET